ncbi:helix-turn-helix domain-containing protein [Paenibacillus mendelii]|uniref:Helix-turn-helix domain-containing protein n=1 Tax=Paenibacillus mendelii TaxID=206163 RepID=A0ABV6JNT6_9BACL
MYSANLTVCREGATQSFNNINGSLNQQTALHFQVSYQQVYQWVKKFEAGGQLRGKD